MKFEQLEKEISKQMNLKLQEQSNLFEKSFNEFRENMKSLNTQISALEKISSVNVNSKEEESKNMKRFEEVEENSRKAQDNIKEINEKLNSFKQVFSLLKASTDQFILEACRKS